MNMFEFSEELSFKDKLTYFNSIALFIIMNVLVYNVFSEKFAFYQLKKDDSVRPGESITDFCSITFKNLIDDKVSMLSMDDVIYKTLKNESGFFDFSPDEAIVQVKTGEDQCRVITKSDVGLRGFLITLKSSINNPLFYKITNINEEEDPKATKEE